MGFRIGSRVGNTYVSTNGHNVRTTIKVGKNVYVTNTFGKKQHKSKQSCTYNTQPTKVILFLLSLFCTFMCCKSFADWAISDVSFETGIHNMLFWFCMAIILPIIGVFIKIFILDEIINCLIIKEHKKQQAIKQQELNDERKQLKKQKEREQEILLKNRLKYAEYNKKQSLKFEREYQAIIKMYPSFEGENHKSIVNTVKKYRQYEYNNVLKSHQKEREELYNKLFESNMNIYNNVDKAIEETVKYLDENFDWLND